MFNSCLLLLTHPLPSQAKGVYQAPIRRHGADLPPWPKISC